MASSVEDLPCVAHFEVLRGVLQAVNTSLLPQGSRSPSTQKTSMDDAHLASQYLTLALCLVQFGALVGDFQAATQALALTVPSIDETQLVPQYLTFALCLVQFGALMGNYQAATAPLLPAALQDPRGPSAQRIKELAEEGCALAVCIGKVLFTSIRRSNNDALLRCCLCWPRAG